MKKQWISAVGKMTHGIYVLTTYYDDKINGMIASWVSQVSYDPPLVMVAVHPNRYSHSLIEKGGAFALHALGKRQQGFLSRFKGSDPADKFAGISWERGKTGCPIITECIAYLDCRVQTIIKPGNHTIFIGEIIDARRISDEEAFSTINYNGIYLGKA